MSAPEPIRWSEVKAHVPSRWVAVGNLQQCPSGAFAVFNAPSGPMARLAGITRYYVVVKFFYDEQGQPNIVYVEPNVPTRLDNKGARELAKAKAEADADRDDKDWDEVPS